MLLRVEVNIVLIGENNTVLTGDKAVDILSDSGTQEDLMTQGFLTDVFVAGMRIINTLWLVLAV